MDKNTQINRCMNLGKIPSYFLKSDTINNTIIKLVVKNVCSPPCAFHFLEHMLLSTNSYTFSYGKIKGETDFCKTEYTIECKPTLDHYSEAIQVIYDIVLGIHLSNSKLDAVRRDIIYEYKALKQWKQFYPYKDMLSRCGIASSFPIGDENAISKIVYSDLQKAYEQNYTAENMALIQIFPAEAPHYSWSCIIPKHKLFSGQNIDQASRLNHNDYCESEIRPQEILFICDDAYGRFSPFFKLLDQITISYIEEIISLTLGLSDDEITTDIFRYSKEKNTFRILLFHKDMFFKPCLAESLSKIITYQEKFHLAEQFIKLYKNTLNRCEPNIMSVVHNLAESFVFSEPQLKNSDLIYAANNITPLDIVKNAHRLVSSSEIYRYIV